MIRGLRVEMTLTYSQTFRDVPTSRRASGRDAAFGASQGETAAGAGLGGSSKYSNENFED